MKKYIQPEISVAQYNSMTLMQAASGGEGGGSSTGSTPVNTIPTDDQW